MKELVVGIDGSDDSRMALRWAAATAQAADVPVRAAQSWLYPGSTILPSAPVPPPRDEMDEQTRQALTEVVTDTLGSSNTAAISVLRGPPAGALLQTVAPDSVLVLGSRGLGGFAGLLLGSVSQECVEYASCAVVVVRTETVPADGEMILVGVDGSDGAQRALAWANAFAGATGAALRAVYAWRPVQSERPPRMGDRLESQAADAVQDWTQPVGDAIASDQLEGDPREVLIDAAERLGAALTVVGRRGAGGLRSMRLGSTANHLIRHGTTSVAVLPAPES
jgi:nucleotide-binding universal stress UspA family protein